MTIKKLFDSLMAQKAKAARQPELDFNGNPLHSGPRSYVSQAGGFIPLTMAGLAVSVDEAAADSILMVIEQRLAEVQKDRTEFIEARRAQAVQEHIKFHHPRIAKEFERVSLVKKSLRRQPR